MLLPPFILGGYEYCGQEQMPSLGAKCIAGVAL